ncbi:GDSL esterase/lipase At5g03980-like [Magnolia sinica]|uniref:GDSL esterase/lipase At5g03980-like n=1 Tax=Magnolia sinica TaxID=86752 RepID=UPI00265AB93D|nr:GDSL esterase/lipase At5g03980-like [Magnolia sinica]
MELINVGAINLVIPGNFPISCIPIYLTAFHNDHPALYDENKCLRCFNDFTMYHNRQLQLAIQELKKEFPQVLIIYADYYKTLMRIINHALAKGKCKIGGAYNFNPFSMCGICSMQGVPVCPNLKKYIHWDSIHLTQEAHRQMAIWLIFNIAKQWKCLV